jgi:OFA family oxalate/formate antiporter-like MFS transporter
MLMVGSGLGSLLLGLGITPAFQYLGWRMVFRILAVLSLLTILLPGSLLCRPPEPGRGTAGKNSSGTDIDYGWREVVRLPSFWLVWFWHLFVVAGGQAALGHIVPFAVESGISVRIAALSMGILAVCNATGRVLFGFLSDRFARKNVMCLAAAMMAAAMACLATLLPYWGSWGLLVSIILTGIAYGGAIPQVSALVASFYGSKHFGANFGLVSTGIAAAALIGPYLSGRMKALTGIYEGSFYFLGLIALIGSILALFTKAPEPRLTDRKSEGAILTGKRADSDC